MSKRCQFWWREKEKEIIIFYRFDACPKKHVLQVYKTKTFTASNILQLLL